MDSAWRLAQSTRRMDSAGNGGICRRFLNGSCRFGPRCNYRHELPVIPSSQICRYFQKGGCWYGERCRYLHVLQPEVDTAVAGRRGSMPTVSSSSSIVAHAPPYRRGSEPALLRAEVTSRQDSTRSESVVNVSNPQPDTGHLPANIAEEQSQETESESVQSSDDAQGGAGHGRNEETSSSETSEDGAAAPAATAAASSSEGTVEETEAVLQSKNVTCGICMEKVHEKDDPRHRMFGILQNCNHAFCLQCILTWRKTKEFRPSVVKSCPQCRVKSAFYVPSKYWVEGQAKESVIAAFKEKFSQKSCFYYERYRRCPFKTDCLYRHDKHARHSSFPYPTEDEDDDEDDDLDGVDLLGFFIAMTLFRSGDDDDDFDFPFYLTEEFGC